MKSTFAKSMVVLAAGLMAGATFAADGSALTREQVRADYAQARAEGTLLPQAEGHVAIVQANTTPGMNREAVQAAYLVARKAGTLPTVNEGQPSNPMTTATNLTREAVKADYFSARKAGTLPSTHEGA